MQKTVCLRDGTPVVIRGMERDDLERSWTFFRELPARDRTYLRRDVSRREVVAERILTMSSGRVRRLVAVVGDRVVADAALELQGPGRDARVAELRLLVARGFRRKGLGLLLARELYAIALKEQVEEIMVKMLRPQVAARSIFRKLGFREEATMPGHVEDFDGNRQDLIVMRCDLAALWRELEDFIETWDWQRMR